MARADFIGVYSRKIADKNLSSQSSAWGKKQLYFVWNTTDKRIFAQPINAAYEPLEKEPKQITPQHFEELFTSEPRIFAAPLMHFTAPEKTEEEKELDRKLEEEKKRNKLSPEELAELEEKEKREAAKLVEKNLRENFSVHLSRMQSGNFRNAIVKINEILDYRDGIIPIHKHMFTDFGIDLRKIKQFNLAVKSFERALELSGEDANAFFNLARLYCEMEKYSQSWQCLASALKIDPNNYYSNKLREHLSKVDSIKISF